MLRDFSAQLTEHAGGSRTLIGLIADFGQDLQDEQDWIANPEASTKR
jgi:hypothetical protein